ncbi:hypothetical protein [Exiguobacterium sp. s36]|uniref:hypothetical protein n=1 Tax=Exiguobacterium sp. s36 TaxID=2751227 RepID=UPI001BE5999A|nr:hypothetical protein [Exiguobacterium sp. s36]
MDRRHVTCLRFFCRSRQAGNSMRIVVPAPRALVTVTVPPCALMMSRDTIEVGGILAD